MKTKHYVFIGILIALYLFRADISAAIQAVTASAATQSYTNAAQPINIEVIMPDQPQAPAAIIAPTLPAPTPVPAVVEQPMSGDTQTARGSRGSADGVGFAAQMEGHTAEEAQGVGR